MDGVTGAARQPETTAASVAAPSVSFRTAHESIARPTGPAASWRVNLPRGRLDLRDLLADIAFVPLRHGDGRRGTLYEDTPAARNLLQRLSGRHGEADGRLFLAPRNRVRALWAEALGPALTDFARNHLARTQPMMSARETLHRRQAAGFALTLALLAAWAAFQPHSLVVMLNGAFAFFYLSVGFARLVAVMTPLPRSVERHERRAYAPPSALPPYSVLVPIYDEAAMVPQLIAALTALDYPRDKLDILILTEDDDTATRRALAAHHLPDHIAVIAVPASHPRTKPKALNVALPLARGRFVTIYDAEDRPDPDQLRKAVAAFERAGATSRRPLGCVQAALHITNRSDSFFTRHFALEYMALFDAFLPALSQLNLPIPLGGTSNHFCRRALMKAGGWDPYNVTEDADLGIRLARLGYATQVIASTTYEEAPRTFAPWVRQRARWFKGWWQTWLVHMRRPLLLMHEVGLAGFIALQTILLGVLVSVLIHPFFLVATVFALAGVWGPLFDPALSQGGQVLLTVNLVNFVFGYAAAAALSLVGAERRGVGGMVSVMATIPLYWVCLSFAGFLALWDLIRRPHHWNKTPHGTD